eukprot:TRINITY_DN31623_c0_g1_i2.p2 TRINITY_DN31623_c0_g1~~TRINITY_DN31623_c0_g1_i2.p2  ORF type:complete len:155 (-),score=3.72 TRINITY_DN31623_c0_g1_i2:339-803(-)
MIYLFSIFFILFFKSNQIRDVILQTDRCAMLGRAMFSTVVQQSVVSILESACNGDITIPPQSIQQNQHKYNDSKSFGAACYDDFSRSCKEECLIKMPSKINKCDRYRQQSFKNAKIRNYFLSEEENGFRNMVTTLCHTACDLSALDYLKVQINN